MRLLESSTFFSVTCNYRLISSYVTEASRNITRGRGRGGLKAVSPSRLFGQIMSDFECLLRSPHSHRKWIDVLEFWRGDRNTILRLFQDFICLLPFLRRRQLHSGMISRLFSTNTSAVKTAQDELHS
jgi:hypothetical protein